MMKDREERPIRFETERQNNPIIQADSPITLADICYYDPNEMVKTYGKKWWAKFAIVCMTDPGATKKEKNCDTGIVCGGWNQWDNKPDIYILDARLSHYTAHEAINHNISIHTMYEPEFQGIEDAGFQHLYGAMVKMSVDKPRTFSLRMHQCMDHGRTKKQRLENAAFFTTARRVYFKRGCSVQSRIIDQLVSYQYGDKFDGGDAYCMMINELARQFPSFVEQRKKRGSRKTSREPKYERGRFVGFR
jgi:hypothetical protein